MDIHFYVVMVIKDHVSQYNRCGVHLSVYNNFWTIMKLCGTEAIQRILVHRINCWSWIHPLSCRLSKCFHFSFSEFEGLVHEQGLVDQPPSSSFSSSSLHSYFVTATFKLLLLSMGPHTWSQTRPALYKTLQKQANRELPMRRNIQASVSFFIFYINLITHAVWVSKSFLMIS